jgi:hypothetical protein
MGLPPIPTTERADFQKSAIAFITTKNGTDLLAKAILSEVATSPAGRILVDGIRQRKTLDRLRELSGGRVGVLFVHTPIDLAYSFFRRREELSVSVERFLALRAADVELEVEGMILESDAILYNWSGKLKFRQAVRDLWNEIG